MNDKQIDSSEIPIYKKWWFWVVVIVMLFVIGSIANLSTDKTNTDFYDNNNYSDSSLQDDIQDNSGSKNLITGICDDGTIVSRVENIDACEDGSNFVDWYYVTAD